MVRDDIRFTPEADLFTTAELIRSFDRRGAEQVISSFSRIGRSDHTHAYGLRFQPRLLEGADLAPSDTTVDLRDVDAVFIRADAPVTETFRHGLMLLALHRDQHDTLMVNDPTSLLARGGKVLTPRVTPEATSHILGSASVVDRFLSDAGVAGLWVVKPLDRNSGLDVHRLDLSAPGAAAELRALITTYGHVQLQPYWRDVEEHGESRHLVFADEIVASWRKLPAKGEFLANRDRGATADAAVSAAAVARAREIVGQIRSEDPGMVLYSVDLIGTNLVEVNLENVGGLPDADSIFGRAHGDLIAGRTAALVLERNERHADGGHR